MVNQTNVEILFDVMDQSATILYETYRMPYLDGLVKTCENIMSNSIEDAFSERADDLMKKIKTLNDIEFEKEEIRKAFQYACLRGFKHKNVTNQLITPDSVGIFMNFLIEKLYSKKQLSVFDPLVGTGNLVTTIANQRKENAEIIGVDNDLTNYKLSTALFDMLGYGDKVFCQNTLTYIGPNSDCIVTDFSGLETKDVFDIIKHQKKNIIPGGFFMGIIDNNLFDDDSLAGFIKEVNDLWYFFGLVVLPKQFFKYQGKSILILQDKSDKFVQPKSFLMVEIPSFEEQEDMLNVIERTNKWFANTEFYKAGE